MKRTSVLFLVLATCLSALPQKVLTNDDIITMVKGGLSDDVILLAIESQPSNFDISAQALIELKQQGASKAVLDKILEVAAASHRAAAPSVQAQPQVTPAASAATQALSPADEQRVLNLVEQAVSQSRRLLAQPMEQNLHELLDQGLSGGDLPAPFKASFVALFTPYRQALHQFLDQEAGRLRQQLKKPSGPRSNLKGPSPFLRPVLWTGGKVFPTEAGPDPMVGSRGRSASRPYRDPSLWLLNSQPACGELNSQPACGEKSRSGSETVGDGVTVTTTFVDWVDTPDSIASGGGVETDITADPTVPVQGTKSGKQSTKIMDGACVDRCPTAEGKVAGKSEFGRGVITEVTTTGGVGVDRDVFRVDVTAEGHVGDDARLREVVVQADWTVEKQVDPGPTTITRWQGTATFDPHVPETQVPLQLTGCSVNQGALPIAQCGAMVVFVSTLRDAYLTAERKWLQLGPEPGDSGKRAEEVSKCVIVKFTPPTRTVEGHPGQTVKVKAELLAVKGNQPTWGTLDDLNPILEQKIEEDGTRTSPGAPGELTYTAPSQPWPCKGPPGNGPPGFGVFGARSRAGAIAGSTANGAIIPLGRREGPLETDDVAWFLAPCKKYSLFVSSQAIVLMPIVVATSSMNPLEIPIEFSNDCSFTGEKQGQAQGQVSVPGGGGAGVQAANFKASGRVTHAPCTPPNPCPPPVMDLLLERDPQTSSFAGQVDLAKILGNQSVTCVTFPLLPTQCTTHTVPGPGSVQLRMPAELYKPQSFDLPFPPPLKVSLTVEIRRRGELHVVPGAPEFVLCDQP